MRNQHNPNPWDDSVYSNGNTQPPKSHSGIFALLLTVIIVLVSLVSLMGLLNIRLFNQLSETKNGDLSSLSLYEETRATVAPVEETLPAARNDGDTLHINQSPLSQENVPQTGGLSLQAIYEKAIPSVVSVSCSLPTGSGSGTGVVVTADGYIITNCHVVENAQAITIRFHDETQLPATVVGTDAVSDLAVLQVQANNLIPAELGDSAVLRVGDSVVAIGDPLGAQLHGTMTDGIVSAINRDIAVGGRTMTLIQTNAALNSGNSGGPLLNCYGQVIGINTMKIGDNVSTAGVEGLGFAIPTTTVTQVVNQLLSQGYVSGRPGLGFTCEAVSSFYQMFYHLPAGVYITEIEPGSPAQAVGMQQGDVVLSLDGTRIYNIEDLNTLLYSHQPGDTVSLLIYRNGSRYQCQLTLIEAH